MTVVLAIAAAGLGLAALLALVRVLLGPTLLDRLVALDVLLVLLVCLLVMRAVHVRDTTVVVLVLAVGLVGFLSSLAVVRLLPEDARARPGGRRGAEAGR